MSANDDKPDVSQLQRELQEARAEQAATQSILASISRPDASLGEVLEMLIGSAIALCDGARGVVWILRDGVLTLGAHVGYPADWVEHARAHPITPAADSLTVSGRVAFHGEVSNVADLPHDPRFSGYGAHRMGDYRGSLCAPLVRAGAVVGVIGLTRPQPGLFTERQVALIRRFADQAVIAIENKRLVEEVRGRSAELQEALERQTATADVLRVISRSAFDLKVVLTSLTQTAQRLCRADQAGVFLREGDVYRWHVGFYDIPAFQEIEARAALRPGRDTLVGRAALERQPVRIDDAWTDPEYSLADEARVGGLRSMMAIPLLRGGECVGVFTLARTRVEPFSERDLETSGVYADQAVIALENARLFEQVQARTQDLQLALDQQTAIAGALALISQSVTDLAKVLLALTRSAAELCRADCGVLWLFDAARGDLFVGSHFGYPAHFQQTLDGTRIEPSPTSTFAAGRAAVSRDIVLTGDVRTDPRFRDNASHASGGYRSILAVPLVQDGVLLGVFGLDAGATDAFGPREVGVVRTFADQAVIAIKNARLFDEVQQRTRDLAASLDELRTAQDRLVQTEKLASLGQLAAGIAHEIKNPLNFVNNFAALSAELVDELLEVLAPATLAAEVRGEVEDLGRMLRGNLEKVASHGRRADSIVKNMLLHSRSGSGERRRVEVNALAEESLNLAYHGARADTPGFNAELQRAFDPQAGEADVFPQEITRVLLNLIGNGFYAVRKRAEAGEPGYQPRLVIATSGSPTAVEIRVTDNGTGIPDHVKQRMFDPFFTTKPAGEGTGLGLSLSHDIVVKQHRGEIRVESRPGHGTAFTIILPRTIGPDGGPPLQERPA